MDRRWLCTKSHLVYSFVKEFISITSLASGLFEIFNVRFLVMIRTFCLLSYGIYRQKFYLYEQGSNVPRRDFCVLLVYFLSNVKQFWQISLAAVKKTNRPQHFHTVYHVSSDFDVK